MLEKNIERSGGTTLPLKRSSRAAPSKAPSLLFDFPFEGISEIAEIESWRKEVYRPIYHIHKWWAQRLGSIFRSLLVAFKSTDFQNVLEAFYEPSRKQDLIVFDPFMGSGTTVGEALKLGYRAIGRDINPVSHFAVSTALGDISEQRLDTAFKQVEKICAEEIHSFYTSKDSLGRVCQTLYYFWVKQVDCPSCSNAVDLFSSYVFAKHAYAKRFPIAQIYCPNCGGINQGNHDCEYLDCKHCHATFNPQVGPAKRQAATCANCRETFSIISVVRKRLEPPKHRMYAKLILNRDGDKEYLAITDEDMQLFNSAVTRLKDGSITYPLAEIPAGHNTNQSINYGYRFWHQMFNARQLVCLNLLGSAIAKLEDAESKKALFCLFSGALEFNNMFASYKGEGTGAVRHMFAHHILKPERTPLEANLWGTPKSSGSFSTLYRSRLLRAIEYKQKPFEIKIVRGGKKAGAIKQLTGNFPATEAIANDFAQFSSEGSRLYLSCGDSSATDIPRETVDLVLTDPPFFDNVHYSELADFFYVWQRHFGITGCAEKLTTRNKNEVQHADPSVFSKNLCAVFSECYRVLKPDGLLVFSYHHSREEGWMSVGDAVWNSGFQFVAAYPVKAEMSVATPKSAAKEPIDLDIILVCRKSNVHPSTLLSSHDDILSRASKQIDRLASSGRKLSRNDIRVILLGQALVESSSSGDLSKARAHMLGATQSANAWVQEIKSKLGGANDADLSIS